MGEFCCWEEEVCRKSQTCSVFVSILEARWVKVRELRSMKIASSSKYMSSYRVISRSLSEA